MKRFLRITICLLLCAISLTATAKRQKPLVWDMERLEQMRKTYRDNAEAQRIIVNAEKYCAMAPISVTENKRLSLGPNKHYFCSMGPYRWPDPKNPGKYIIKDGEMNPDWKYYDSGKLNEMITRCYYLSQAFYMTRNRKYYNAYLQQLRVWFLDESTYMEPNFEYSQADPTQDVFKSNSTGMIEAYVLINLTESIYLVNSTKRIDRKTMKAMKNWMRQFAEWSDERYTAYFEKVDNNISIAFDVTLADLYLFAGEKDKAKRIVDDFAEKRLSRQIKEDGSQPSELTRTRAYYYSLYNLSHVLDFCSLAQYWYPAYFEEYGKRIEKAYEFLGQYLDRPENFPYKQITSWEECRNDYTNQMKVMERLKSN